MNSSWRTRVTVFLLLVVMVNRARADAGFPGFKFIHNEVTFELIGDHADYIFFLTSTQELHYARNERSAHIHPIRIEPGEVYSIGGGASRNWDYLIIAIPRTHQIVDDKGEMLWAKILAMEPGPICSNTFPAPPGGGIIINPTDTRRYHLCVALVDHTLTVTQTGVDSVQDPWVIIGWIAFSVAVAWLGLFIVRRRGSTKSQ